MGFVHLHVHSQYSFLDGASPLDRLLEKAAELGMHDLLHGNGILFWEKSQELERAALAVMLIFLPEFAVATHEVNEAFLNLIQYSGLSRKYLGFAF